MTASEPTPASPAPAASGAPSPAAGGRRPRTPRRGFGLAGLALVLALVALIVAVWSGWRLWQLQRGGHRDSRELQTLKTQLASLHGEQGAQKSAAQALQQQVRVLQQQGQDRDTRIQGLGERSRSLENAVAGLTERASSGHDAVRLDEVGMLLRMADERFALFHDSEGAMRAYALADRILAQVEDPAYAAVRQSIASERAALAATHPSQRSSDLDTLSHLREAVDSLPLKPVGAAPKSTAHGFWARVEHAFSGLVQVRRDDAFTPVRRDMARMLVALDLAQAQASLLAWDQQDYRQALARAEARIQHDFDTRDQAVRDVLAGIAALRARSVPPAPQLGAALRELDNLRAVHDAAAPPASTPAPAAKGTRR